MSAVPPDQRGRVSNPDWPGPYWQDQQDQGPGWRNRQGGAQHEQSPWEDSGGFWRSSGRRNGQPSSPDGTGRRPAGGTASQAFRGAGARGASGRGGSGDDRVSRSARPAGGETRSGRFSSTADDLRNRLGIRGSVGRGRPDAAGQGADDDFWEGSPRRRDRAAPTSGHRAQAANGAPRSDRGPTQAWRDSGNGRGGYRGARRAGGSAPGRYDDTAGRPANGRTAVRDRYDETGWGQDDGRGGLTSLRTRVTERVGRGGGRGGRTGGGGGRGGRGYNGMPLTRGQRFRRWLLYGSWWRHWTVKKVLGVLGAGMAAFILLCIGVFFLLYSLTPVPTAASEEADWQSSNVYLANGQLLGTFSNSGQTRQLLTPGQIPKVMTEAMTAAEDRNFYHEGGISVTALMRAAYDDILGHGAPQGGSTLTMQYAKNYYSGVNSGQTISTEIKEIFIAMKLGREQTKTEIMTNYLNVVPFGPTENGLGAGAQAYFDINLAKPGTTLTVPQAAMLAAMPNAPGYFDPDPKAGAGYSALVLRYEYVLNNMVRDGNITAQQAATYDHEFPKLTPPPAVDGLTGQEGYLWQMVQQELEAPRSYGGYGLSAEQLDRGGYQIRTTFSLSKVDALVQSVNAERAQVAALQGAPMPQYDWIGSVLENAKTGAIVAIDGGPGYGVKNCAKVDVDCQWNRAESPEEVGSSFKPYVLATAVNEGMNVFTSKLNGFSPIAIPYAPTNASGGPTESAIEQQLSLLRPPPGDSQFFTPNEDQSQFPYNGEWYKVFDEIGEDYNTAQPVNIAAAVSSDPAFEDLAHRDGTVNIANMAASLGVGDNPFNENCPTGGTIAEMQACSDLTGLRKFADTYSPSITFGGSPLTAVEQASTFATFADDGLYHSPHVIASVEKNGTTLPSDVVTRRVLSPAAAADVDWALSFDNNYSGGTANATVSFRRGGVIGKTGTLGVNEESSEAWFVGATPNGYSLSVALYTALANGTTQVLNTLPAADGTVGEDGGAWPASIWNNYMTKMFGNQAWLPVNQVFQTVNALPFVAWIQVKVAPPRPSFCRPGHFQDCICRQHGNGGNLCGNPGPTQSCGPFGGLTGQNCGNTPTPNPSSNGPTPSPSPSPTPSPSATPTTSPSGGFSPGAGTAADVSGARASPAIVTVAAEEQPAATASTVRVLLT
jgi:membrane peptidoglycan carboxypeptidase